MQLNIKLNRKKLSCRYKMKQDRVVFKSVKAARRCSVSQLLTCELTEKANIVKTFPGWLNRAVLPVARHHATFLWSCVALVLSGEDRPCHTLRALA